MRPSRLPGARTRSPVLAVFVGVQILASGCGRTAPTDATGRCPSSAGTYSATFSGTSCALPTSTTVLVEQHGCELHVETAEGAFHGDLDETGAWEFEFNPAGIPCLVISGGTAHVVGSTIHGTYRGTAVTQSGCCAPFTVNFTWTRQ